MYTRVVVMIPGWGEWLVIGAAVILLLALILIVLRLAGMRIENKRENVRLRLEVGKLAEELEQARKQRRAE